MFIDQFKHYTTELHASKLKKKKLFNQASTMLNNVFMLMHHRQICAGNYYSSREAHPTRQKKTLTDQEFLWHCTYQAIKHRYMLWCIGVLFTRLSQWEPGFKSHHRHALLSFSKAIYPHCCSPPRCINGDPVLGCDRWLCLNLRAPYRLLYQARNAPQGVEMHCKCGIEMYPMTGVIICFKRFGPYEKSAYMKTSYHYYYYY